MLFSPSLSSDAFLVEEGTQVLQAALVVIGQLAVAEDHHSEVKIVCVVGGAGSYEVEVMLFLLAHTALTSRSHLESMEEHLHADDSILISIIMLYKKLPSSIIMKIDKLTP